MKKFIKNVITIILILLVAMIFIMFLTGSRYGEKIIEKYKIKMYGEPIDKETGLINNNYFNINSTGEEAKNTTNGLNEALEYCKINGIEYIKLQKGEYLVNSAISILNNMEIDLNSSIIQYETNEKTSYIVILINDVQNVRIKNGSIMGDKDTHNYTGTSTHEWGMGISIKGSTNVELDMLDISDMTGDAIYITNAIKNSSDIRIKNCKLSNNRRQGISVISGEQIDICYNEIYSIKGTNPQSGIDLEANNTQQKIDEIYIHNNKFYDFGKKLALALYSQVYSTYITDNEIYGNIAIYETKETTKIINNTLQNGAIYANLNKPESTKVINNIYVCENNMFNYDILYDDRVNNIKIENNNEL